jgi:hypothetical protein
VPSSHPLLALLVWLRIFLLFGMPVALIATATILLPLARSTGDEAPWWSPTLIGATAGQVLFLVYLHVLAPRGTLELASGAGAIAGATGANRWIVTFHDDTLDIWADAARSFPTRFASTGDEAITLAKRRG